jgi:hypothetical protein
MSAVEKELAAAVAAGKPLDLSRRAERTVRAEVIRDLVRKTDDPLGVQLRGAHVAGELDLDLVKVAIPVLLDDCVFDERPTMFGSEIPRSASTARRCPVSTRKACAPATSR